MNPEQGSTHPGGAATLVIVRHGETEWSASGRHTGRTDLPLSARGVREAEALASRLAGWNPVLVLASPRTRARATAELAGFGSVEIDENLAEWDYGDDEGLTSAQICARDPGWTIWRGPVPGGECIDAVAARADHVIARVLAEDGPVVCFAHGHISRMIAARWCELEPEAGARFALETAHFGVLGHERETRVVVGWNR